MHVSRHHLFRLCCALGLAAVGACVSSDDNEKRDSDWRADGHGFPSPIPLPVDDIEEGDCVEQVIEGGEAADTYDVNGNNLVDLGIFHIHRGVEHVGLSCPQRKCDGVGEGHIVLGTAECRGTVLLENYPNQDKWAEAMLLKCANTVLSFPVCINAGMGDNIVEVGDIIDDLGDGDRACINFGGPTGSHAGDPMMVQWIHAVDACEPIDADLVVDEDANGCVVKASPTAPPQQGGDTPACGYIEEDGCESCGNEHERCCGPDDAWFVEFLLWLAEHFPDQLPGYVGGCDEEADLTCVEGRCHPKAPCGNAGERCCTAEDLDWQQYMPDSDGCDFIDGLTCVEGTCIGITPDTDTDTDTDGDDHGDTGGGTTGWGEDTGGWPEPMPDVGAHVDEPWPHPMPDVGTHDEVDEPQGPQPDVGTWEPEAEPEPTPMPEPVAQPHEPRADAMPMPAW